MKTLLKNTPNKTDKQNKLRHIVISTMGHMLGSFSGNPGAIKDDIVEIINLIASMQGTLAEDDNQHRAILEVYDAMLAALKSEFVPFMDKLMDQLIRCASRKISLTATDSYNQGKTAPINEQVGSSIEVDLKMLGGKKILSLNPCIVEQKVQAFHVACNVFKHLKKDARPYFPQLLELFVSHANYKLSRPIIAYTQKAVFHILNALDTEEEMA